MGMKYFLFFFFALITLTMQSQHTITGTLSPAKDYRWIIAYHLRSGVQDYVADAPVKNGKFSLKIKGDAPIGTYRLVYAVPQEEFNFDLIYNGKEDVTLTFDPNDGLAFTVSEENRTYASYAKDIAVVEQEVYDFYSAKKTDNDAFMGLMDNAKKIQTFYEKKSEGLLSHNFITASTPYTPDRFENVETYIKNKGIHYFDAVDFNNKVLQQSSFLNDKVLNYVFTALPVKEESPEAIEAAIIKNISDVAILLINVDAVYKTDLYEVLWSTLTNNNYTNAADVLYSDHLKALATETGNTKIIDKIEVHNRLRLGAKAPEISWDNGAKKLSTLKTAEHYILVFWSSTCSHCLRELPKLHQGLKGKSNVKVIAVGLEDGDDPWKKESAKMSDFIHVISLGRWESTYARLYAIQKTPTYFILDKDKRIVAKPDDYMETLKLLE